MIKKILGIFLVAVGLLSLVTPLTPGAWLIFIGLELAGFRILFWDKVKTRLFTKVKLPSESKKRRQAGKAG